MGGVVTLKLSNSLIINPSCPHLYGPLKISYPPYLSNGDRLGKFYYTIGLTTFENGGVGHLKTQKKKPNFGGDTHVTLNPKTLNPLLKYKEMVNKYIVTLQVCLLSYG
jgi:hypothetical protein